jgi:hypothetical protein
MLERIEQEEEVGDEVGRFVDCASTLMHEENLPSIAEP